MPEKIVNELPIGGIKEINVCGDSNIAVSMTGEAFMWPVIDQNNEYISCPTRLPLTEYLFIDSASCGENFAILLSTQGLLLSFGQAASAGQLGHGDTIPRIFPEVILGLKNSGVRIQTVSCGYMHVVAKSTRGKVYTWGCGEMGQLGHSEYECEFKPRMLEKTNNTNSSGIFPHYNII